MFAASGVATEKLVVVPEPVDTAFFDPSKAVPLQLPQGQLVFGAPPAPGARPDTAFVSVGSATRCAASSLLCVVHSEAGLGMVP